MKKKTQEQFIAEAIAKHGDKYGYSKVVYTKTNSKVIITCKKCSNIFEQTPKQHLKSIYPCNECLLLHKSDLFSDTSETFIKKSQNIHKDEYDFPIYDYSKVEYINSQICVLIICKKNNHGPFTPLKI